MGKESRKNEVLRAVAKDMAKNRVEEARKTLEEVQARVPPEPESEDSMPGEHVGVSTTRWEFVWVEEPGVKGWKLWMKPDVSILSVHVPKPRLLMTVAKLIMDRNPILQDYFLDACLTALNTSRTVIKLDPEPGPKCQVALKHGESGTVLVQCGENMPCKDHPPEPEQVIHDEPKGEM